MAEPAYEIQLSEVDVELTLLGSLLSDAKVFQLAASEITPDWFSDPLAKYVFDGALRIHQDGGRISPPVVVAMLPEDCGGGVNRGQFYARMCAHAMPAASVGALVTTLKDRWARRQLVATADDMRAMAVRFEADPYELARDAVLSLDSINAVRGEGRGFTLDTAMERLGEADPDKMRGFSTGLHALNVKLNGYKAGQLYVIAGRPGMGKSAFMCSSLRRTAQTGVGVAIFSLEMTGEEIAARCLSDSLDSVHAPMFGNILKGAVPPSDKHMLDLARDSLSGLPLYIDDSPKLTFAEITGKARRAKAIWEAKGIRLGVVCIDHMGLVTPSSRYAGNKVAEAGEVSGMARALAKELDCCVVLLCQLSREVEKRDDKRPVMSDLRWSGEIEQDAHVIGFLYREAYYLAQDPTADPVQSHVARNALEFLIRKNRNGETADVRLWCSIGHSSIRDIV
jgi:replicative DNA helicase